MLTNILYDVIHFFSKIEREHFQVFGEKGKARDGFDSVGRDMFSRINMSYSEGYSEGIVGRERSSSRI